MMRIIGQPQTEGNTTLLADVKREICARIAQEGLKHTPANFKKTAISKTATSRVHMAYWVPQILPVSALVLSGIEFIFFIEACVVPCFGFVIKRALVTEGVLVIAE